MAWWKTSLAINGRLPRTNKTSAKNKLPPTPKPRSPRCNPPCPEHRMTNMAPLRSLIRFTKSFSFHEPPPRSRPRPRLGGLDPNTRRTTSRRTKRFIVPMRANESVGALHKDGAPGGASRKRAQMPARQERHVSHLEISHPD